ncbi:magnesium-protoporphyrin IX monomethyl ester anaerobic oxidative cyclase [Erythrobacter donghaensis]|uniref:magnesium-protoporphyrin IX monomethyl ester anaerobic oxidative cyclase n=1 Tax=Erythrobacter donghaensis TaxID=267135 RepID=UPI001B7FFAB3|nr:magnesium-protoporphyrin IX monomethyl ester anaerobic oxidative cyclase [Erythrobacter donghaensis]
MLINIPHPAIGSRIPREQLPPLGLLSVGGPLIDDGHEVHLIDGEFGPMPLTAIVAEAAALAPDVVMFGHSGSSSGHPIIAACAEAVRARMPEATIVYGGVHPTYFWRDILAAEPWVDVIVRGEGEETARQLARALAGQAALDAVPGLALRQNGAPFATPAAPVIKDLDAYRIGWELIDHARYSYWGGKRAVVVQFSRGCPHLCTYCGQRGFWTRWRHRDPIKFAAEIARLHRDHGVEVFNFADENPSAGRKAWKAFLEALIAEDIDVTLVGSTRADDIVRDAEFLHLYKKAGFERFLMGTENTDEDTLRLIRKGGATTTDREAIRLLRQHNILSMATWVAGFSHQTDRDMWHALKTLISYDPDQIQALYVVPHRWTPYYAEATERDVVQPDRSKWDYKHQVLGMAHMPPWRLFLWVKAIEAVMQLRPRALRRLIWNREAKIRHAIRWYYRMGRRVWLHEVREFLLRDRTRSTGVSVERFVGASLAAEEEAMQAR